MLKGDGDRLQGDRDVRNQEESEEEREEISNKRESERVSWRGGQLVDVCFSSSFFSSIFRSSTPRDPAAARRNRPYDWRGRLLAFLLALPVFLLLEAIKAASKEL